MPNFSALIRETSRDLEVARKRWREHTHRKLHQWKGETDDEYAARRRRYRLRTKNIKQVKKELRSKKKALRKARRKKRNRREQGLDVRYFDGVPVADWIYDWLVKSRKAGWKGTVYSGYRDPAYSEQVCINKCGKPSCPGTCAGRSSNHSGKVYPDGAVDVSDYYNFERIQYEIGSPLRNDLPYDPNHFSVSGR